VAREDIVTAPRRAALYARVSTDEQSTGMQLDDLRRLAEHRGWKIAGEYIDQGISGAKASRPDLDRLMGDARAGKLDVVAVWRFDRFARSTQHLLAALEEFRAVGVDFVSVRESIDTSTPMGRMVFTMVAAVAELERELIRERVIAGIRRAQAQGRHVGRKKVEIDLRPAVAMLDKGHGIKTTARSLGVSVSTLRRRLTEAGEWPRPVAKKSA
jgi:DNA invertase Pin-like site-specific DNA recombinase